MITLTTPVAVALGRRGGRLSVYDIDGGKYYDMPLDLDGLDVAELKVEGDEVKSHIVLASYSTSFIKAIAVNGDAEMLDREGLKKMRKDRATLRSVKGREFGKWDDVWNKLILISGPAGALALGASRAGVLLHLNVARTDRKHIEAAVKALEALRPYGDVSVACSCRLGLLPVEILARRKTDYILVKIYMNINMRRNDVVVVLRGSGGNISKRLIGPLDSLNLYIEEASSA
ncbi:MAG: hypothetical protein ABWJ97_07495 [Thermoproteus sp.]